MTSPPETPPAWPLATEPTEAEAALWHDLWTTRPAASLWPRFGLTRDVATYVQTVRAFEIGGHTNAALGGLVARMAEALGLTVAGAARNRWSWPTETTGGPRNGARLVQLHGGRQRPSARDRFARGFTQPDRTDDPTEETHA
ncbi:hypothetical protein [Geodermatophilus obscurus]|nr:hypothetical protein [Geodermatophilus obscurus]